jgi:hypothetical protein
MANLIIKKVPRFPLASIFLAPPRENIDQDHLRGRPVLERRRGHQVLRFWSVAAGRVSGADRHDHDPDRAPGGAAGVDVADRRRRRRLRGDDTVVRAGEQAYDRRERDFPAIDQPAVHSAARAAAARRAATRRDLVQMAHMGGPGTFLSGPTNRSDRPRFRSLGNVLASAKSAWAFIVAGYRWLVAHGSSIAAALGQFTAAVIAL